jgi:D-3-phosphoglycerate dehydrogenase
MLDADVVISGGVPIGAEVFGALRRTRLLLRPYIGYDNIDVAAATRQRILVANVPDAVPEDVANHTVALLLAANRKLHQMDRVVRTGAWARGGRSGSLAAVALIERLSELTLGLIGVGGIGRLVAARARAFGFRLLGCDPYVEPAAVNPDHCMVFAYHGW